MFLVGSARQRHVRLRGRRRSGGPAGKSERTLRGLIPGLAIEGQWFSRRDEIAVFGDPRGDLGEQQDTPSPVPAELGRCRAAGVRVWHEGGQREA